MSFRHFLWATMIESAKRASHLGHIADLVVIFVLGAFVWAGFHFEQHAFIWIPVTVFIIAMFILFTKVMHSFYTEANQKALTAQASLKMLQMPKIELFEKDENGEPARGDEDLHWRVTVKNLNSVISQPDCQVSLVMCDPPLGNLPLPLHCSQEAIRTSKVDLGPDQERRWDVCREDGKGGFVFTGLTFFPKVPLDSKSSCRIKISAFAKDAKPETKWYELVQLGDLKLRPISDPEKR